MVALKASSPVTVSGSGITSIALGGIGTEDLNFGFYLRIVPQPTFTGRRLGWLAPAVRTLSPGIVTVKIDSFPVIGNTNHGYVFQQEMYGSNGAFEFYPRPFLGPFELQWGYLFQDPF